VGSILNAPAKVPKIRFYDLRHTCGTFLHKQGASPFVIQEILGHSQLSTTRRYTHVDRELQKSALGKVGDLLKRPAASGPTAILTAALLFFMVSAEGIEPSTY